MGPRPNVSEIRYGDSMDNQMERKATIHKKREVAAGYDIIGHNLVICMAEDLDHHNATFIKEQSDKLLNSKPIKNIIFDFSGTNFMDSSGIGVIMGRYKKVMLTGGKAAVTGVNVSVDRILKLSGLYKIIPRFDTIEDALKNFSQ